MSTKMLSGFAKDPAKKKRTKTLHRCFRAWSAATRHAKLIETHGEKFGALLTRRRAGARLRAWSKAAARSASKRRDEARSRQLAGSARRSRFRRFVVAALRHWHWAALRRMSRRDVLSSMLDALALRGGRARVSASFARWARGASARAAARGRLSKLVRRVKTLETRRYWNAWAFVVAARREALTRTLRDHARDYEANAHRMCRRAFAHWRVVADAMVLARDADERDERRARGMFALRAKFALASAFRHWRRGAEARGERSRHAHFASVHWSRRCKWRAFRGWRRALESAAALERREDAADRLAANRRARRSIQRWRASASEGARARFVRERAERMVRATRFRRLRRAWYSWRASVRPREARRVILRLERETRAALVREAEAVAAAKHFRRGDAMRRVMSGWRRYAARKAVGAERVALAERVMRRRRAGFALRAWRDESGDIGGDHRGHWGRGRGRGRAVGSADAVVDVHRRRTRRWQRREWFGRWRAETLATRRARERDATARRALARLARRGMGSAFETWRTYAEDAVLTRFKLHEIAARWLTLELRGAFEGWAFSAKEGGRLRRAANKIARRWKTLAAASAFGAWRDAVEKDRRLRRVGDAVARRWFLVSAAFAFERWAERVAEAKRLRRAADRVALRWTTLALVSAFDAWANRAKERRRLGRVAARVASRWTTRVIASAFDAWVSDAVETRRLRVVANRVAVRWTRLELASAFGEWWRNADAARRDARARAPSREGDGERTPSPRRVDARDVANVRGGRRAHAVQASRDRRAVVDARASRRVRGVGFQREGGRAAPPRGEQNRAAVENARGGVGVRGVARRRLRGRAPSPRRGRVVARWTKATLVGTLRRWAETARTTREERAAMERARARRRGRRRPARRASPRRGNEGSSRRRSGGGATRRAR